ncbi:MAG: hypothetical protein HXY24_14645 [Rubrivivax sp.]|nr:hypothetical protein [Rubrivivax sp.]
MPDTGTYTGQQEPRLAWLRDGVLLGHEYGQDSSGWRFLGRQRLGAWCDVTLSYEQFRQLRDSASPARTTRFDVVARHDLGRTLQLGLGYRSRRLRNAGGVASADSTTDTLYLEARASY